MWSLSRYSVLVELKHRGIGVSDMWHGAPFPVEARLPGPDPQRTSYGSFFAFGAPDGNAWLVQEVTTRRPGRGAGLIELSPDCPHCWPFQLSDFSGDEAGVTVLWFHR
jgi:hypothetical protein